MEGTDAKTEHKTSNEKMEETPRTVESASISEPVSTLSSPLHMQRYNYKYIVVGSYKFFKSRL